ncbi:hypothetical protein AVEN_140384-1 [Araneus ventricosus]|uniref:Uncharacterized protein n=1 Tax=Araneus ventricosus TaxID=182803 RepID=A0A4Y2L447_ARAVE|nr:hypothetical protein AVEN_140384-1 [Araneus ventricosus]
MSPFEAKYDEGCKNNISLRTPVTLAKPLVATQVKKESYYSPGTYATGHGHKTLLRLCHRLKQNMMRGQTDTELHSVVDDDPRRSAELYQVHEPVYPKEIQSQQRIRNEILFGKPQACKNMIRCGLFCGTFWADLKTLRIIRESQTSDMPTKEASKSELHSKLVKEKEQSKWRLAVVEITAFVKQKEGCNRSRRGDNKPLHLSPGGDFSKPLWLPWHCSRGPHKRQTRFAKDTPEEKGALLLNCFTGAAFVCVNSNARGRKEGGGSEMMAADVRRWIAPDCVPGVRRGY